MWSLHAQLDWIAKAEEESIVIGIDTKESRESSYKACLLDKEREKGIFEKIGKENDPSLKPKVCSEPSCDGESVHFVSRKNHFN